MANILDKAQEKLLTKANEISAKIDSKSVKRQCELYLKHSTALRVAALGNLHGAFLRGMAQDYKDDKGKDQTLTPEKWLAAYYAEPMFEEVLKRTKTKKEQLEKIIKEADR